MAILLAGLTSILYGVFDFAGGMATRRAPVFAVAFWANVTGLGLALVIGAVHHILVGATATATDFVWGPISGVAGVTRVWPRAGWQWFPRSQRSPCRWFRFCSGW